MNFLFAGMASTIGSAVGNAMIMPAMGKVSIPNMPTVSDSMVTVGGVSIPGTPNSNFGSAVNSVVNGATGNINVGGTPGSYPVWPTFPGYGGAQSFPGYGPNPYFGAFVSGSFNSFYAGLGYSFGPAQRIM